MLITYPMSGQDSNHRPPKPKGEFTNTATFTATANEKTSIVNLGAGSRTIAEKRPVPILQVTSGNDQGRIVSLGEHRRFTLGRSKDCDLPLLDPSCSRIHAEIFSAPDESIYIKDMESTNGTKVNSKQVGAEPMKLEDGDRIQLGDNSTLRFSMVPEDEAKTQLDVYYRATRDALTNAFNRRQFEDAIQREVSFHNRGGNKGLGLIMFDVDHFKKINDGFGHQSGDEVLREIGKRVPHCIRREDIFSRIGGEEFAILTRNDGEEGLTILAERIRQAMDSNHASFEGRQIKFTVSVGYTLVTEKQKITQEALIKLADEALYEAKNSGRNKCVFKVPA